MATTTVSTTKPKTKKEAIAQMRKMPSKMVCSIAGRALAKLKTSDAGRTLQKCNPTPGKPKKAVSASASTKPKKKAKAKKPSDPARTAQRGKR